MEVNVDLPWPAFLPRDYVPGQKLRIEVYRRLARLRDPAKLDDFRQELRDRYGPHPEPVEWLLRTTEMRLLCVKWQVAERPPRRPRPGLHVPQRGRRPGQLAAQSRGRVKVVDERAIYLRLKPEDDDTPEGMYQLLRRVLKSKARPMTNQLFDPAQNQPNVEHLRPSVSTPGAPCAPSCSSC